MDELRFIDLSGLRALAAAATAAGVRVELHGVPAVFWRYWYLAGFSEAVTGVYPVSWPVRVRPARAGPGPPRAG
jgi:hypothetical protein